MKSILLFTLFLSLINGLKILISGDLDDARRLYFYKVGQKLAANKNTDHIIYFLTNKITTNKKQNESPRFIYYGIPTTDPLTWDYETEEEDNYLRLEKE